MGRLWPNDGTSLDILLSLGTGRQLKKKRKIPLGIKYGFFTPIIHVFERQMDTERTWDELVRNSLAVVKPRLYRLSPEIQGESGRYVDLDDHHELEHLLDLVHTWTGAGGAADIKHISRMLIASLFFFEPDLENLPQDGETFCGSVRCRLQHASDALKVLLEDRVTGFWHGTAAKAEIPELEKLASARWRPIKVNAKSPAQMVVQEDSMSKFRLKFRLDPIPGAPSGAVSQVIAVELKGYSEKIAISGFPASLSELNERSKAQWLQ
jgi:hypothetical protein